MEVLLYYAIFFVSIYILAIVFRDKLKVDVYGPLLMRRTKKMRGWIDNIANLSPKFWRWSMNIGIPIAVFGMAFMVYTIIISLEVMFQKPTTALLLPGVDIPGSPIFVPIFAGIIALILLMVVHEFGHGILARAQGVGIKSIGVILLAILPGAFVELEEEDVEKAKRAVKLRIYAAGSMFNLGLAAIAWVVVIVLTSSFIPYAFQSDGLKIISVTPNGPSEGILEEGMVVSSINGYPVNNRTSYTELIVNKTKPGDQMTYVTDKGTYTITATGQPSNQSIAYPGTRSETHLVVKPDVAQTYGEIIPWFLYNLADVCYWIYALNLMVGLFNLLPMKPLDGGYIFEELLRYKVPENITGRIVSSVSWVMIAIVALLIIYGTVPGILQMF
ncbi:site-2 protease family protein [Methanobacterium subterraneum]|uniref:Membrane-associated Zn-dependent protease n=1 Tax=Methanobacterium subterraneum TaxID=59277 RepID=A0A7K4DNH2_9EURY|nr:site-2 protease family protein [Methanobacterium subterraneum]MBW4256264.1 site-2 protease family protein [Methanobacterium sp. YSL]NMO09434.1 membrane-associated Zn-dependent protease [Methanobacterium subterraneum]PKL74081.1 MAG: membrane-associated Zn-dependent protease [Methanobacteriales archaeon HGW-Methanobacteriales-2]